MDLQVVLFLVVQFFYLGHGLSLSSKSGSIQVSPGQNITLTCTVIGQGFNAFSNPIIWYKMVGGADVQINTGAVINGPFDETGRYTIEPNMTVGPNPSVQMPLEIKGVTLAENGTYRCELRSIKDVLGSVTHNILVPVPLDSLTLTTNETMKNNSSKLTFDFVELEASYVSCKSVGGNPKPSLRMYRGRTDITGEFQSLVTAREVGKLGLQVTVYEMELVSKAFRVTKDYNGHHLRCVSRIPKFSDLKKALSATMNVKYAPRFICDSERSVFPDVDNYTINCLLKANPIVDTSSIIWILGSSGQNLTIGQTFIESVVQSTGPNTTAVQTADVYSANATVEDPSKGEVIVTLVISNMTNSSYQTYHLRARNEVGERHFDIEIKEAFTTVAPTTAAPTTEAKTTPKKVNVVLTGNDVMKPVAATSGDVTRHSSILLGIWILPVFFWTVWQR